MSAAKNELRENTTEEGVAAADDERYLRMVETLREQSPRPTSEQLKAELEHEKEKGRYRSALRHTISVLIVVAAISVLLVVYLFSA